MASGPASAGHFVRAANGGARRAEFHFGVIVKWFTPLEDQFKLVLGRASACKSR